MNTTFKPTSQSNKISIKQEILEEAYPFLSEYLMLNGKGSFIERLYEQEPILCAQWSEEYHRLHPLNLMFKNGTIQREIQLDHCLGVLLLAQKDVKTKKKLFQELKLRYPKVYDYTRRKSTEMIGYIETMIKAPAKEQNGIVILTTYLLWNFYGAEFNAPYIYAETVSIFEEYIVSQRIYYRGNHTRFFLHEMEPINCCLSRYKTVTNCADIRGYMDQYELNRSSGTSDLDPLVQSALIDVYTVCAWIMDTQNLSFSLILEKTSLFKEERQYVGDILESVHQRLQGQPGQFEKIEPYLYIMGVIFTTFCKEYNSAKNFFDSDNSKGIREFRAKYQALEANNQQQRQQIDELQRTVQLLNAEAAQHQDELEQSRRQAEAECHDEITALKEKVAQLEAEQAAWQAQAYDYARLKEMAYTLELEDIVPSEGANLEELIRAKKIFVVGGSESWRKQLNAKYPQLRWVSGTQKNLDLTGFQGADHVFIYTGHMAHTVYNKLAEYLYKKQIPYSYVPRYNLACIEQCIMEKL